MLFKLLVRLSVILLFLNGCNSNSNDKVVTTKVERYKVIPVPFKDSSYNDFQTQTINSKEAYTSFISSVKSKNFLSIMETIYIDFKVSNLILFRFTEDSSSYLLTPKVPEYNGDTFTVKIDKSVPKILTQDMAHYTLAYVVDKKTKTLNFYIGDIFYSVSNQLDHDTKCTSSYAPVCASKMVQCITAPCNPIPQTYLNSCMLNLDSDVTLLFNGTCPSGDDIVPENCKTWYDGCNSCSVFETGLMACTEMYCNMPNGTPRCTSY